MSDVKETAAITTIELVAFIIGLIATGIVTVYVIGGNLIDLFSLLL